MQKLSGTLNQDFTQTVEVKSQGVKEQGHLNFIYLFSSSKGLPTQEWVGTDVDILVRLAAV